MSEQVGGGKPGLDLSEIRATSIKELGVRFIFGFVIAVVAGFLGQRLGPLVGGLFLAFPAILPAALTLVAEKEGERRAEVNALGAILGTIALACCGLVVAVGLSRYPVVIAQAMATVAWVVTALALYFVVERAIAMSLEAGARRRRR